MQTTLNQQHDPLSPGSGQKKKKHKTTTKQKNMAFDVLYSLISCCAFAVHNTDVSPLGMSSYIPYFKLTISTQILTSCSCRISKNSVHVNVNSTVTKD